MKKTNYLCGAALLLLCLGACSNTDDPGKRGTIDTDSLTPTAAPTEEAAQPTPETTPEPAPDIFSVNTDLSTNEAICQFIQGEWFLTEKGPGTDYASIRFDENGGFVMERLSDGATCDGSVSFTVPDTASDGIATLPTQYQLKVDHLADAFFPEDGNDYSAFSIYESSGSFLIGRNPGNDFLALEETGEGDSVVSLFVFNPSGGTSPYAEDYSRRWILTRGNEFGAFSPTYIEAGPFYAMGWKRTGERTLLLQPVQDTHFEAEQLYTNRMYEAIVFSSNGNCEMAEYTLADDINTDSFYFSEDWGSVYPLRYYKVWPGEDGMIQKLEEVPFVYADQYLAEFLPGDYSYEGMILDYNGDPTDLSSIASPANAITGYESDGSRLAVECHINPHTSAYVIFNENNGFIENVIYGTNLCYKDSLYHAVYADGNSIYDYEGDILSTIEDAEEIFGLSFEDEGILVKYSVNGSNVMQETTIPEPEWENDVLYHLVDFSNNSVSNPSLWSSFYAYAPKNADFLVMVNPPETIQKYYNIPLEIEKDGLDKVMVVSLCDDFTFHFADGGVILNEDGSFELKDTDPDAECYYLNKGDMISFQMTVPEGLPRWLLCTSRGMWPVGTLSGENDICYSFIEGEW